MMFVLCFCLHEFHDKICNAYNPEKNNHGIPETDNLRKYVGIIEN